MTTVQFITTPVKEGQKVDHRNRTLVIKSDEGEAETNVRVVVEYGMIVVLNENGRKLGGAHLKGIDNVTILGDTKTRDNLVLDDTFVNSDKLDAISVNLSPTVNYKGEQLDKVTVIGLKANSPRLRGQIGRAQFEERVNGKQTEYPTLADEWIFVNPERGAKATLLRGPEEGRYANIFNPHVRHFKGKEIIEAHSPSDNTGYFSPTHRQLDLEVDLAGIMKITDPLLDYPKPKRLPEPQYQTIEN